ncbi:hypothetical protein COD11_20970 [Bacillus sp. AFS040349]|nr:hypothetical protein COD11_20970 [Bacillus sp. AFS040349]
MKKDTCDSCHCDIQVTNNYVPEFCCSGYECGCYGMPINPVFCDDCEKRILGTPITHTVREVEKNEIPN